MSCEKHLQAPLIQFKDTSKLQPTVKKYKYKLEKKANNLECCPLNDLDMKLNALNDYSDKCFVTAIISPVNEVNQI